jgi:hypothetical protein
MSFMFHHGTIVRLKGIITGKLGEKEIREQRSENEGFTGGSQIYFGRRGLTREKALSFQPSALSHPKLLALRGV